ncbi:MAG: protein kinase, partial [Myxococcales bacterium]|nr:protein kinase [Myxococcales bacterium]
MSESTSEPTSAGERDLDAPARQARRPATEGRTAVDERGDSALVPIALDEAAFPIGSKIARYTVLEAIGSGGVGIVFACYDPDLDRKVAVKLLRPSKLVGRPESADIRRGRLLREAQALARLSHPNVVPIYEVGTVAKQIYLVMEFVEGTTLSGWLADDRRGWAEVVAMFIQAGRGLAAAHAAGIVHRDFKPENVLLGNDGRVRIVDFGLVKVANTLDSLSQSGGMISRAGSSTDSGRLNESMTSHDSFVGTPAYAAPEHWDRRYVDAHSDQYAFCVSLWEALCGIRPDRRERGKHGLVPLPDGARMAKRLHRALSRGLALESDQRYPDMPTLLADLEPPQRKWLVPAAAAASTAVLATAVGFALVPATQAITEDPCALATAPIDALWTEDRAKAVTEQLEGSLGSRAAAGVSEWAQSWATTADQSCREVHVHHRHSEASLDRQSRCLDRALQGFTGLLETVEQQQLGSMAELHTWLGSLDQPQDCLGEVAGQVDYDPVPDGNRDEAIELRRAALQQLASEDPLQQRISATEQLLARAREIGWKPLIIDISLALARLHQAGHHVDQARTVLGQVIDLGTAAGDLERVADAWLLLQEIHLRSTFEMTEAQWAWQRAAGLFAEVSPSKRRKARLSMGHGSIQLQLGKLAEAEKDLRAA